MIQRSGPDGNPLPPLHSRIAAFTSSTLAARSSDTETDSVCPSSTAARVHVALTTMSCGTIPPSPRRPKIFFVSRATFSSSFGMNGITLSSMSSATTPGERPAPEMPCMVVTIARFAPNASTSGFIAMTRPAVVQFGIGVTQPFQPRRRRCISSSLPCAEFTPGTRIGTSSS